LGLWFSVLLRPDILPRQGPSLAFLAAAAVREAVAAAGGTPVFIKWPNDVVAGDGGKLAGILVEMDATQSRIRHCIVGVGVNVNQREEDFPPELRAEAVSVRQLSGSPLDRVALLRAILAGFASRYSVVVSEGFGPLLDEVRRHSATVGRTVRVLETTGEAWDGRAVAIQDDGALLVEPLAGGAARAVYAADVSIRPVGRRDHGAQAPGAQAPGAQAPGAQAPGANAPGTKTPPGPGFGQEPGERQGGDPV